MERYGSVTNSFPLETLHALPKFLLCLIYFLHFGRRRGIVPPVVHHVEYLILDIMLFFQTVEDGIPYVCMDALIGKSIVQGCG